MKSLSEVLLDLILTKLGPAVDVYEAEDLVAEILREIDEWVGEVIYE